MGFLKDLNLILWPCLMIASLWDWSYRKVPNSLILSMLFIGLIWNMIQGGWGGLIQSIAGFAVGIACLYLPFALGGMGGGDVKLLAAIGAVVGPVLVFQIFLASAVLGGVVSLIVIFSHETGRETLKGLKQRILYLAYHQKWVSESELEFESARLHIPYALVLSVGSAWVLFLGGVL